MALFLAVPLSLFICVPPVAHFTWLCGASTSPVTPPLFMVSKHVAVVVVVYN